MDFKIKLQKNKQVHTLRSFIQVYILRYFCLILLLQCISGGNIVLFTPLHLLKAIKLLIISQIMILHTKHSHHIKNVKRYDTLLQYPTV